MTGEKYHQSGFFLTEGGKKLTRRPEKGSEMIKPKVKKEPKPRKLTPWRELMQFYGILRKRANIFDGYGMYEDLNGNLHINQGGVLTELSTEASTGMLKKISGEHHELPAIPQLSDAAQRLKYVLEHQKQRKPFVTDHLVPRPAEDPFGKPLK